MKNYHLIQENIGFRMDVYGVVCFVVRCCIDLYMACFINPEESASDIFQHANCDTCVQPSVKCVQPSDSPYVRNRLHEQ